MENDSDKIRLLMVDDEPEFLESTATALRRRGLDVATAANGMEAIVLISQMEFDAVLLDVKMPGMNGVEVLQRIAAEKPRLPVLMLTGHGNVTDAFQSSKLGVVDYLSKPYDLDYLTVKIREMIKKPLKSAPPAEIPPEEAIPQDIRVLLVDDEEELLASLTPALKRRGFAVEAAESGDEALKKIAAGDFDVMVLDVKMPGLDGVETLKRMKALQKDCEVIMLTGHPNVTNAFETVKSGAADYIMKPPDVEELAACIHRLYEKKKHSAGKTGKDVVKDILEKYPG